MTTGKQRTIVFDLDGTISDPIVGISRSFNYALAHFGHAPLPEVALLPHIGPPLDDAFRALTGVSSSSAIAAYVAKYRERYSDIGYSENVLYPGIAEALQPLAAAGIPLGICTSKRRDFAQRILDLFQLRSLFRFVDGGDIGIPKWRQIEVLVISGQIGRDSVMVGDRSVDLDAAHRNGLSSGGVLWGYGSRQELEKEHPRYLFSEPCELRILAETGSKEVANHGVHGRHASSPP
ncbi:MAG: HAD hydrolase-like protein [Kiritimatiellae bacterium]|nr:HAD hydrolase-like protein [Kiritimatiellia bacterium]